MVLLPRVGREFQAQIPDLITGPEYSSYLNRPVDTENKDHVPFDFFVGLPVPVTLIRDISIVSEKKKDERLDFSAQSTDSLSTDPCYVLVPGVLRDLWNDTEEASFLLGLYLFKKKFVELKEFVGSKKMGELLFFYYTAFYKSSGFNTWSTCGEGRKGKRAYGTWLFKGFRHQELLSRLSPKVSEERQKLLREVTEKYAEKDMSLTEYVFSIKSIVGLETFVNSVAIGKGNRDLTSMVRRPVRIPVGEACSNLEHAEIVKILTGSCRLTKVQSSDLFWEAVWPRLLARGWHSEQPKNKASLVFLPPCVEKFSRKLVKGNHYFESFKDVLSKVGSEPELLQLDTYDEGEKKEEKGLIEETKEQQNFPKKRHFSLPHTSLDNGKSVKSKKLKTLPSEMIIVSRHSEEDNSFVSTIKSNCIQNVSVDQQTSSSNQLVRIDGPETITKAEKQKKLYDDKQAPELVDIQLSQKLKRDNLDTSLSVRESHGTTTACTNEDTGSDRSTFPLVPRFGYLVRGGCSDVLDPNSKAFSQVSSSQNRRPFTSSPKGNPCGSTTRASQDDDSYDQENSQSGMFMTNLANVQDDITSIQQDACCALHTSADKSAPEQPIHMNSRRQSTRNKLPTARALEALVDGDLTVKRRRK
ncbi:uncharacterized protein LOC108201595 [Daucus carota subsp. sativus]|uniref:uncharacterized protein LOC108201595 n=1 Tax=Daucus carota subsp. sativus TaxID=79200 RepID=UPI003083DBB0